MLSPLLTFAEVCERLRIDAKTLRKIIASGDLKAAKVGRAYRISEDSIEQYLEAQATKATA